MKLLYHQDGVPDKEFTFVPQKLMSPEAEAIERVGRPIWDSFEEFGVLFMKGNMRARRAALWIMLKRETPTLKFDELSISSEMLEVVWDEREQQAIREAIAQDPNMDSYDKEVYLRQLDAEEFDGTDPLKEESQTPEPEDLTSVDTVSVPDSES